MTLRAMFPYRERAPLVRPDFTSFSEGECTVASDSKIFRDKAARELREARKAPLESQRNILIEISATYKRIALDEERLRCELLRSRKR
jgi:hypothetical protein